MAEQTHKRDMSDEPDRQDLEDRVEQLESTISKMLPSRRDALKLGGAALVGGAAMSGSASAGTGQAGTIGTANDPVDVESEDINNADTVTTQDLVLNGTATGPLAPALEAGDSITVESFSRDSTNQSFVTLYDGTAKDVLGGTLVAGRSTGDFLYTFADNTTLRKNGGGTSYTKGNRNDFRADADNDVFAEIDFLPPAKNVIKVEVAGSQNSGSSIGAEIILRD